MQQTQLARWSRYLIYFILAVLPLERIPSYELTHPLHMTIRLSQIAGVILIALNLPLLWRTRAKLLQNPWRWLVAFWVVCILSTGLAMDLKRAVSVTAFTLFAGLLAWVFALRLERAKLRVYLIILGASALAVCLFGYYQFFGDLLGLSTHWTGLRDQYTKGVFGFPRIQSTALEPLYFGDYLLIPAGVMLAAIAAKYRSKLLAGLLIPIFAVVWLTVSRGAIVALVVMLTITIVVTWWRKYWLQSGLIVTAAVISVGLAYGLLYLGSHYVTQKPNQQTTQAITNFSKQTTNISNGESSEGRTVTRDLALQAFRSHPVLGIGPGNFGSYASLHMPDRFSGDTGIVNNEPLEILAETGALGIFAFGVFVVSLLIGALRIKLDGLDSVWRYGLVLALVGIAIQYQTFSTLYITHIWVAIGLLAGLVFLSQSTKQRA
ncbi:MAG TPA: O-antigen ligase family protein [Candidatus Saccharimonadia bacterium]|nr:O-antigen ligase family protein [Candidatus Saccharimonadia bacterium]